jgi:hypothetical protein
VCGWLRLYVGGALLEQAHKYDKYCPMPGKIISI